MSESDLNKELYKAIPKKDFNDIKGLAYKIWVKSFAYISIDDLVQEGVLAYLMEKKKYDSSKNDYFMGYAYKRIRGAMLDFVARNSVDKYKTVRKSVEGQKESAIVPAPENVEQYHINEDGGEELFEYLYREEIYDAFKEYADSFTELEKFVLYSYFVEGKSMLQIGEEVKISRLKIKVILVNCVSYLKHKFDDKLQSGVTISEKDVNLKVISRGSGKNGKRS